MRVYFRLLGFLRPYKLRLTAALACMVLYAVTSAVSLGLVAPFMKVLFEGNRTTVSAPAPAATSITAALPGVDAAQPDRLAGWPAPLKRAIERLLLDAKPLVALERVCILILIVFLLKNAADYLQAFLMVSVEQAAIRDLRNQVYAHLQSLPLAYFHGNRAGTLLSRITNDVEYLRASLASGIGNLVKDSLTLIG